MKKQTTRSVLQSTSTMGVAILAALVTAFAGWMYLQSPNPRPAEATPSSYESPAGLTGFRPDAWFLPDDTLLGFVEIPAGPFLMGGDPSTDPLAFENERWSPTQSQGTIDLPRFFIGRFEVTVAQFAVFVTATRHPVSPDALASPPDHPVATVSWPDALAYCRWLETTLLASPDTPEPIRSFLRGGAHVTLPSEAEWEKAARGTDGRVYPWGSDARSDRANYASTGTVSVGRLDCPECPFAISDMSGNVWEWTRSPYQAYPFDQTNDRSDLDGEALWVMRGGSFTDTERNVRTGIRGGAGPDVRRPFIGFRLAISKS